MLLRNFNILYSVEGLTCNKNNCAHVSGEKNRTVKLWCLFLRIRVKKLKDKSPPRSRLRLRIKRFLIKLPDNDRVCMHLQTLTFVCSDFVTAASFVLDA